MKKRYLLLLPILTMTLSGCEFLRTWGLPSSSEDSTSESSSSSDSSSHHSSSDTSSSEHSSSSGDTSSSDSSSGGEGTATIEVYATNDIHGYIKQDDKGCGIGYMMTYLKNKKDQNEHTLLLDQGDTWQGSIYSNYNHGALITDVMNYIHYDGRSVGNHDFDWGTTYIEQNTAREYNGYSTPVFAGNVYDYNFNTKVTGTTQQSQLGCKSVTYTLDNGIKVGILGGIGQDQITSINTQFVTDIVFTNHTNFIKEEAYHLRNDLHCDVVIASIHTGQENLMGKGLENYIDLALCGHTHQNQVGNEGNLYYAQSTDETSMLKHITLTYDFGQKDVVNTSIETVYANQIVNQVSSVDPTIEGIIDTYNEQCETAANEVVAKNVKGSFSEYGALPNLMTKAIYDAAVSEGHTIVAACVNKARESISKTTWTYADLYQSFPFDNKVYIAEVSGYELIYQIGKYNYRYVNPSLTSEYKSSISYSGKYKVAVLDYLYFHANSNRDYDDFTSNDGTCTTTLPKTYRETLRDWLISNGYNTVSELNSNNYIDGYFSKNQFSAGY